MMDVKIYQINATRDTDRVMYLNYDTINGAVNCEIYDPVFSGEVKADNLEDVYYLFNMERPPGFRGHFLSVSDIVEVVKAESIAPGFYFCDSIGFREIAFQPRETMTVVLCEPGKTARVAQIGTTLEDLQAVVGGLIQPFYAFEDPGVCIVCNEEGKYNGMRPCRAVYTSDGQILDIINGPFFICDCNGENFNSLSREQQERYENQFQLPEYFLKLDGEVMIIPYEPRLEEQQR